MAGTKKRKSKQADSPLVSLKAEATRIFTSPDSPTVEGGTYDPETGLAVIGFKDKKKPDAQTVFYSYEGMSKADWDGLEQAEHKQTYINQCIKGKYKGVRIG